jgi:predicted metal-dependent phosphoesterase TrpH
MRADLHLHTSFSYDGLPSPKEVVDFAISKNLDCVAICDHEKTEGAIEALNYAKGKPILVIPGIEIKTKQGEVLGLNIKEKISQFLEAEETIEKIIKLGGLPVIAHPFDIINYFKGIEKYSDFIKEKKVAIEAFNASLFFFSNFEAEQFVEKFNLPFTAGSDAHSLDFIGKAYLEIPKEDLSIEAVLEEIKKKNAKIGFEKITSWEKFGEHLKRIAVKFRKRK